ncbi:MAG: family 20 glycosylhydrolase [Flavobacteriales bacterium]|nr:family 20 glycosylhydrolase [Flavobacteriales bacterium]
MARSILVALAWWLGYAAWAQRPALMPLPADIGLRDGRHVMEVPFRALLLPANGLPGHRVGPALERFQMRLAERTGNEWRSDGNAEEVKLFIRWERTGRLVLGEDETYSLTITPARVEVQATTDLGILRGLSTLYQCLAFDGGEWYFPALVVKDQPRFPWRGLLLDVCRHWMPRDVVLRQLEGMELVKMNVLHLHLTEDQGFRVESKIFPELHRSGSNGQFFTQEDVRYIIEEADKRGIRVIPEFDLPGHATSWFVSHPELASAPGPYAIEKRFGVIDPTFDPTREEVYLFLDRFLGEMAALFPDAYMHIGGDENNGKQWAANLAIQAFMKERGLKDAHDLQAYFNGRLYEILTRHGKRMIGWDEIAEGALPQDVTIQSWRGKEGLISAARAGRDVVLSNGWYIDLCQPTAYHYANDPLPDDIGLSPIERKRVLGGEATMWSELVNARNVDTRIWPRTAAIAERLWSPAHVKDVQDLFLRLEQVTGQLENVGLRHRSAQMELLRLFAGTEEVDALKRYVDLLSPVQGYQRHSIRPGGYSTATPLTRLVDAAVPDPLAANRFEQIVDEYLRTRDRTKLDATLDSWGAAVGELLGRTEITSRMSVAEQQQLLAFSELVTRLGPGRSDPNTRPPSLDDAALLAQARPKEAEVVLAVLPAIERLLKAREP